MRLIIIVTYPSTDLWIKVTESGWRPGVPLETEVRERSSGEDEIAIFCQASTSSKKGEEEKERENRLKTTPWVIQVAEDPRYAGAQVYVAAHLGYVDLNEVCERITPERFGVGTNFNHEVGSPAAPTVNDELLTLVSNPNPETFNTALRAVKKKA